MAVIDSGETGRAAANELQQKRQVLPMTTKPVTMKVLALSAASLAAAIAFAPQGSASTTPGKFEIEYRFNRAKSAVENYAAFLRLAQDACNTDGRLRTERAFEKECVETTMAKFVAAMGRTDLASIHADFIGHSVDSSRSLAAR